MELLIAQLLKKSPSLEPKVKSECELCTFSEYHRFILYINMKRQVTFNILWLEINGVLKGITKSINNNFFQRNQKENITSNLLRTFNVFGKQHLGNYMSEHSKFLTHQNNSISNCSLHHGSLDSDPGQFIENLFLTK